MLLGMFSWWSETYDDDAICRGNDVLDVNFTASHKNKLNRINTVVFLKQY